MNIMTVESGDFVKLSKYNLRTGQIQPPKCWALNKRMGRERMSRMGQLTRLIDLHDPPAVITINTDSPANAKMQSNGVGTGMKCLNLEQIIEIQHAARQQTM
jgi:hypothetical protein